MCLLLPDSVFLMADTASPCIPNKSENATLQLSIFSEKVLDKKYLLSLIILPRHPTYDSSKLHQFVSFDVRVMLL